MFRFSLVTGLVLTFIGIIIQLVFYYGGFIWEPWSGIVMSLAEWYFLLLITAIACYLFRRYYEGYKDLPHVFLFVFLALVITGVLLAQFDAIFYAYIEPHFTVKLLKAQLEKFPDYGKRMGYTQEEIAEGMKNIQQTLVDIQKNPVTYPFLLWEKLKTYAFKGVIVGVAYGFLFRKSYVPRTP